MFPIRDLSFFVCEFRSVVAENRELEEKVAKRESGEQLSVLSEQVTEIPDQGFKKTSGIFSDCSNFSSFWS